MTTPIPLWLKLAVLPFLAGAAFCVDYELQVRIAHFALANRGDPLGILMVGTGKVCGPLLAAGLVAYPIARMFEKHWALACLALVLTISWFYIKTYWIDDGDPIGAAVMMTTPLLFALLVPALARGAYLWIQDSQLVLTQSRKDDTMGELVDPRALKLLLLPIFAIGLFLIHDFWQPTMHAIGFLPTTRTGDRIGLMCAAFLGPALLASLAAFPIARIYGRWALLVGVLVPMLTTGWSLRAYLASEHSVFVGRAQIIEFSMLALLTPLLAWWLARRWKGSGLMIFPRVIV